MSAFSNASGVVLRNAQLCDEASQQTNRHARTRAAAGQCRGAAGRSRCGGPVPLRGAARLHASINSMVTMLQQTEPAGVRCAVCCCDRKHQRVRCSCASAVLRARLGEYGHGRTWGTPCDGVGRNDAAATQRRVGQLGMCAVACVCVCLGARAREISLVPSLAARLCRRVIMSVAQKVTQTHAHKPAPTRT